MRLSVGLITTVVLLSSGCAQSAAPEGSAPGFDSAMEKCVEMASTAMPNGMQDPEDPGVVWDSARFCLELSEGYSREMFAELYNDPEWLESELLIWSDEGLK
jgi:hypothetical protein